jgi:hypothetical protein
MPGQEKIKFVHLGGLTPSLDFTCEKRVARRKDRSPGLRGLGCSLASCACEFGFGRKPNRTNLVGRLAAKRQPRWAHRFDKIAPLSSEHRERTQGFIVQNGGAFIDSKRVEGGEHFLHARSLGYEKAEASRCPSNNG